MCVCVYVCVSDLYKCIFVAIDELCKALRAPERRGAVICLLVGALSPVNHRGLHQGAVEILIIIIIINT